MTTPTPETRVTRDQLAAPLDIPAELCRAQWAPKWTLVLPIALLAAFTMPALPLNAGHSPAPMAALNA